MSESAQRKTFAGSCTIVKRGMGVICEKKHFLKPLPLFNDNTICSMLRFPAQFAGITAW